MNSPLRALIAQTIKPIHRVADGRHDYNLHLETFQNAASMGREALLSAGVGLDLAVGERILAAAQDVTEAKGHQHRTTLVITDRKTVQRGWSTLVSGPGNLNELHLVLPHTHILRAQAKKAGLVESAHVLVTTQRGAHKITLADATAPLGSFYEAMASTVAPAYRMEPPSQIYAPPILDAETLPRLGAELWFDDKETMGALHGFAGPAAALPPEQVSALVMRLQMAHRACAAAPMSLEDGRWFSPLDASDFGQMLTHLFGAPAWHDQPQPSLDRIGFHIDPRSDTLGHVLNGLGMASFLTLGIGFSPARILMNMVAGRKPVTQISVAFQSVPHGTAYQVFGSVELHREDAFYASQVHTAIAALTCRVLQARLRLGWSVDYASLWT